MASDYASKTGARKFFSDFFGRLEGYTVVDNTRSWSLVAFIVLWFQSIVLGTAIGTPIDALVNKDNKQHVISRLLGLKNVASVFRDYAKDGRIDEGYKYDSKADSETKPNEGVSGTSGSKSTKEKETDSSEESELNES